MVDPVQAVSLEAASEGTPTARVLDAQATARRSAARSGYLGSGGRVLGDVVDLSSDARGVLRTLQEEALEQAISTPSGFPSTYDELQADGFVATVNAFTDALNGQRGVFNGVATDQFAGASFVGQNLSGALFDQANLAGTDFAGASLQGASFVGADLTGANFNGADLSGANFSGATGLTAEQLRNARVSYDTLLPGGE